MKYTIMVESKRGSTLHGVFDNGDEAREVAEVTFAGREWSLVVVFDIDNESWKTLRVHQL